MARRTRFSSWGCGFISQSATASSVNCPLFSSGWSLLLREEDASVPHFDRSITATMARAKFCRTNSPRRSSISNLTGWTCWISRRTQRAVLCRAATLYSHLNSPFWIVRWSFKNGQRLVTLINSNLGKQLADGKNCDGAWNAYCPIVTVLNYIIRASDRGYSCA